MSKLYSKLFRKKVKQIEVGGIYISDENDIIRIVKRITFNVSLGGYYFYDTHGQAWFYNGISYTLRGRYLYLYNLNEKDKRKYWPRIIKDD